MPEAVLSLFFQAETLSRADAVIIHDCSASIARRRGRSLPRVLIGTFVALDPLFVCSGLPSVENEGYPSASQDADDLIGSVKGEIDDCVIQRCAICQHQRALE